MTFDRSNHGMIEKKYSRNFYLKNIYKVFWLFSQETSSVLLSLFLSFCLLKMKLILSQNHLYFIRLLFLFFFFYLVDSVEYMCCFFCCHNSKLSVLIWNNNNNDNDDHDDETLALNEQTFLRTKSSWWKK